VQRLIGFASIKVPAKYVSLEWRVDLLQNEAMATTMEAVLTDQRRRER
jgi:hypothetical protein